jgi:DeoR/GlpR family transcriptional regulator of sugar metabolism
VCFMGVTGIHPEAGLSTGDLEEAHIKRALIASASETYVLVSAEKLNAASPYVIAALTEIDGMIVEAGVAAKSLAAFERKGFSVIRA